MLGNIPFRRSNLCWLKNTEMDAEMNDADDDDKFLWGKPCASKYEI